MYQHTKLRKFKVRARRWLSLILTLALMISLLMIETPTVHADTNVGGPIISDTTWTLANSPYIVVENVEVWEGVTLTIEPGVTVKFDNEKKLQVNGELIAQGTASNLITFTSNQASPAPGDWGNIEFTSTAITTTMDADGNYISGSILQYCVAEYAGVNADSAIDAHSLLIDHCTVRNNDARGIYDPGTANAPARITNNTVSGNSGYSGGGIYATYSTVTGNTVNSNSAPSHGGGIYASYSTVTGNTVSGNSAGYYSDGGGIYTDHSTVTGNTVSGNLAIRNGGGIYATYSTVSGNVVISNSVVLDGLYDVHGGGIYASYSTVTSNTVRDNSVTGHWARDEDGGGIYAFGSTVIGNTVIGNSTHGYGARGGGIFATRGSVVNRNTVNNNSANDKGGGIYADGRSIVNSNIISGNSVRYGGGIYADYSTVSGNAISDNSASDTGGGIFAYNSTVLTNTVTSNTTSNQGAGVYFSGSNDFRANYVVSNTGPISYTIGGVAFNGIPQVHYTLVSAKPDTASER